MSQSLSLSLTRRAAMACALSVAGVLFGTAASAAEPPINTLKNSLFGGRTDTAINGYDTVAYFTVGKPVKGQDALAIEWMGAKWKFSTQAHLDLFKANPEKYAPQYGGYCAYGVVQDNLVKVEPEQFTIRDGKLYLNYDASVQKKWEQDVPGFIVKANQNWPSVLGK